MYVLSRAEWYWNLAGLLLDDSKADESSEGLRTQLQNNISQLYEKLLLYQMKSICVYRRHWATTIGRDMLKVDDWASQLSKIKEAEATIQRDMDQYSTEEIKRRFRELNDIAAKMDNSLESMHNAIEEQTRQQEARHHDETDKQCLRDIRETDPRDDKKRIQDTKGGLLTNSYQWILGHDDFCLWRDDPQNQLLWIKGDPGKGKTMLLCGIIDELQKKHNTYLSYFLCQATETRLRTATAVLRGLIYLLVEQKPSLISHIRKKYDHAGKGLFEDVNAWIVLSDILLAMIEDRALANPILIIDALDECEQGRDELLRFITQPSRAKWIVSSRNWVDIEEQLNKAKQKVKLHLELNEEAVSQAVNAYIKYKVSQLADSKNYTAELRDDVERHLTDTANGTFLWVALVCQELANPKVRRRHTLHKLKSFPPGLQPLYSRMVEQILSSEDADLCKEIMAVVLLAYRPITLDELQVLVPSLESLSQTDTEELIKSCGSFITLRKGILFFVHQSAKDYLMNEAKDYILPYGAMDQHRKVFSRSLKFLTKTLRRNIYDLSSPEVTIDQVPAKSVDPLAKVRYSCTFWIEHLCDSTQDMERNSIDSKSEGYILEFLKSKYLQWLEALSLLRSIPEGLEAMGKLELLLVSINHNTL